MSQHIKRAYGFQIILLNNCISIVRSYVLVLNPPGYFMRFPPSVRLVRYWSYFWGRESTTIRPYIKYFLLFSSILLWVRKTIVFVISNHSPKPWCQTKYIIGKGFDPNWSVFRVFNELYVLHDNPCVLSNDYIGNFIQTVMLCYWLGVSCQIYSKTVLYQVWGFLPLIV